MTNEKAKELCLSLMKADSEGEVIKILTDAGYWQDDNFWRFYGDNENNVGVIGSQQRHPDQALVEKLVNAVDARLMGECLSKRVDPTSDDAPDSIKEAVRVFFGDSCKSNNVDSGSISEWSDAKRKEIAEGINLCATGYRPKDGQPCFTIVDKGEGQTPSMMPETLLSLAKSNKIKIRFVQGQFNQGGSGVLRFCGDRIKQLIISKRNPMILDFEGKVSETDDHWGFTIVRREDPVGGRRNSVYTYLAPCGSGANERKGGVLSFKSDEFPIFAEGRKAYSRSAEWGTLIKLYEYQNTNYNKSHILLKGGLQARMDLLLPYIALPVRAYECRDFQGGEASFSNNINGLSVRLHDGKAGNIEGEWDADINVDGEPFHIKIYVFYPGRHENYKRSEEGIIFSLNGQTQGSYTSDFFIRKSVKRSYLKRSLLVIADCSDISLRARERLFMNSRDRISGDDFSKLVERELEDLLKNHHGLKALEEKRRRDEAASKLADDKPLEDILQNIFHKSPLLSSLFLKGVRASNPFKVDSVAEKETIFEGKRYPTFFKFKSIDSGSIYKRGCPRNKRARIFFETDASNDFFSRKNDKGESRLVVVSDAEKVETKNYSGPYLHNGTASLNVKIPEEAEIGDVIQFQLEVSDSSRVEPIVNVFEITVLDESKKTSVVTEHSERKPPSEKEGARHEAPLGIKLPKIEEVCEDDWGRQDPPFDKYIALRVIESPEEGYDFKINVGNIYLKTELKSSKSVEHELVKYRFVYGMVLVGLALLHEDKNKKKKKSDGEFIDGEHQSVSIYDAIETTTKAVAPILLPMINSLADLELSDNEDAVGEAS